MQWNSIVTEVSLLGTVPGIRLAINSKALRAAPRGSPTG
jgi:hypothetical protein